MHELNRAGIYYKDENEKTARLENGDFIIPGFDLSYYYYPDFELFKKNRIYINLGFQSGINIHRFNKSIDVGAVTAIIKEFYIGKKHRLNFGVSGGIVKQKLFKLRNNGVNLVDNKLLYSFETVLEYNWLCKNKYIISAGLSFRHQSPYHSGFLPKDDNKYLVFSGDRSTTHWHLAATHMYDSSETLNFIFSLSKKYKILLYVQEDFFNNAPDVQTGISVFIPLGKK